MSRRSSSPSPRPKRLKTLDVESAFALHDAARTGCVEDVREVLERKKTDVAFAVDTKDSNGFTAFAYACRGRHFGVMRVLLEFGADPNQKFPSSLTKLTSASLVALGLRDTAMMACLLEFGLQPNEGIPVASPFGNFLVQLSLLFMAVASRCVEMVRLLLEHGAHVDAIAGSRKAALHAAVKIQNLDIVSALLAAGASPDLRDRDGDTPLRLAASLKNLDIVAKLVEAGASVDLRGFRGVTPMRAAAASGCAETVRLLLQLGASPNESMRHWPSPLHDACVVRRHDIAEMLLDAGAHIDHVCGGEETPLLTTVIFGGGGNEDGLVRTIRLLADRGADLDFRGRGGRTALRRALHCPLAAFALLLEVGADPNVADDVGDTPLHAVVAGEASREYAEALMRSGADVLASNDVGDTPFNRAMRGQSERDKKMMKLILENTSDEMPPY